MKKGIIMYCESDIALVRIAHSCLKYAVRKTGQPLEMSTLLQKVAPEIFNDNCRKLARYKEFLHGGIYAPDICPSRLNDLSKAALKIYKTTSPNGMKAFYEGFPDVWSYTAQAAMRLIQAEGKYESQ